jgi:hypothetical protein
VRPLVSSRPTSSLKAPFYDVEAWNTSAWVQYGPF